VVNPAYRAASLNPIDALHFDSGNLRRWPTGSRPVGHLARRESVIRRCSRTPNPC